MFTDIYSSPLGGKLYAVVRFNDGHAYNLVDISKEGPRGLSQLLHSMDNNFTRYPVYNMENARQTIDHAVNSVLEDSVLIATSDPLILRQQCQPTDSIMLYVDAMPHCIRKRFGVVV